MIDYSPPIGIIEAAEKLPHRRSQQRITIECEATQTLQFDYFPWEGLSVVVSPTTEEKNDGSDDQSPSAKRPGRVRYVFEREQTESVKLRSIDSLKNSIILDGIIRLDNSGGQVAATAWLYDHVDRILSERKFDQCDEILGQAQAKLNLLSSSLLRSLLSITRDAKYQLSNRSQFFQLARARIRQLRGDKADRILDGLE